ncbi:YceI family protein [Formosa sp. A9]|uniref:YceI family protein n=1 Tax=Formosa sp. A9 TaxID=3442641 RepID=UPI003EB85F80
MLKKYLLILLIILCGSCFKTQSQNTAKIHIQPSSVLSIKGSTNINKFTCKFNTAVLKGESTVHYTVEENDIIFSEATLILKNDCFDCGKKMITKDFRELIKAETYPEITLTLKALKPSKTEPNITYALIDFDIAGVTQSYKIPMAIETENVIKASGALSLNIRDFNLENPKKAFGLIKIDDVVTILFELDITMV